MRRSHWGWYLLIGVVVLAPAGIRLLTWPGARRQAMVQAGVMNLKDSGPGSLRQAILDTPAGGTVRFQPGLTGTITLTTGELVLNKDLNIVGPGASVITVSGNKASRVFDITITETVAISGLTIADGSVTNANGGGIYNAGTLTITDCTLSGNTAHEEGSGGGIYTIGTMTFAGIILSGNSARKGSGIHCDGTGVTNMTGDVSGDGEILVSSPGH